MIKLINTIHYEAELNEEKSKYENKTNNEASDKILSDIESDSENDSEDELDLYQIETVNDEEVYACILCIEAFDFEKEVIKHLRDSHKNVIEIDEEVVYS